MVLSFFWFRARASDLNQRKKRLHCISSFFNRQRRRAWYLFYFLTIIVLVCYLCAYVPVALFCESVINSGRKVCRFSNTETASTFVNRPHRRQKVLTERKWSKKEFRRYAKRLRKWHEFKLSFRNKYGWLASLLCEPWFAQFALCAHWFLTWWISLALRVNITGIIEENCWHTIWKEWEAHCSNLSKRRFSITHAMRSTGYRSRKHRPLDEQRQAL